MHARLMALAFLVLFGGCKSIVKDAKPEASQEKNRKNEDGEQGEPPSNGSPGPSRPRPSPIVSCEPQNETLPYRDLRRLTRLEYQRAIEGLFPRQVLSSISSAFGLIPADRVGPEFDSHAQGVTAEHVRGYATMAETIGQLLERNAGARARVLPCLDGATDESCIVGFLNDFGPRVLRRPLQDEEQRSYLELYRLGAKNGVATGLRMVVASFLQSPDFLLKMEVFGPPVQGSTDQIHLTEHELAAKLAFYIWGDLPDEALLAAAANNELGTDAGLTKQLDRMLADERAILRTQWFFEQWMQLDTVPDLENLSAEVRRGQHTQKVNQGIVFQSRELVNHVVWELQGNFGDLMTTNYAHIDNGLIAQIYKAENWECCGPTVVRFTDGRRNGLLTRMVVLAGPDGLQHPIFRGKFIRKQILCGTLLLPDESLLSDGALEEPEADPDASTRERFAKKTESAECAGCHTLMNPLGFALGNYDGMGRYQTEEYVLDSEGKAAGTQPVNAEVDPNIEREGVDRVNGAVELGKLLADHPVALECMAQHWLEFNMARDREGTDACAVQDLTRSLSEPAGFLKMIRGWVLRPEFRVRRILRCEDGGQGS